MNKTKTFRRVAGSLVYAAAMLIATSSYSQPYADHYSNIDEDGHAESCTSIIVSKGASSDGSVMTAHSCDSNYRTWLTIEPRKKYADGKDIIKWGLLHTEEPYDIRNTSVKGSIPAIAGETYKFLNVAYPCMNEKQLAMGETTTEGKRELVNEDGLFLIEELERVALERCDNARDAIRLMGSLAEEYGYGDYGECLTVIDKNEAWFFEIYGTGKSGKKPGAMWVAQRIPDGEVGVSANVPKIGVVDFNDPEKFMYSKDLRERAKELKLWDGKSEFKFYPMVTTYKKNFMWREYFVLNKLAPGLGLKYSDDEMPFSVVPEEKMTPERMFGFYRETFKGTEFDPVKDLKVVVDRRGSKSEKDTIAPVSPFMPNNMRLLLNTLKPESAPRIRTIAVIQCSYSHIVRLRGWLPDEIGGVAYFSFDNPAQSPRIPIYAGQTKLPEGFNVCGQKRYRKDAAIWDFRETNRLATICWDRAEPLVNNAVASYEKQMMEQTAELEKKAAGLIKEGRRDEAVKMLDDYCEKMAASQRHTWGEELKGKILMYLVRSL